MKFLLHFSKSFNCFYVLPVAGYQSLNLDYANFNLNILAILWSTGNNLFLSKEIPTKQYIFL